MIKSLSGYVCSTVTGSTIKQEPFMLTGTPETVSLVPINWIEILNSRDRNMKVFEEIVENIRTAVATTGPQKTHHRGRAPG
jgi:hypothetical protein